MNHRRRAWLFGAISALPVLALVLLVFRPALLVPPPLWQASSASGPHAEGTVHNFGTVETGILYRSAQPRLWDYLWLRSMGIKSIVNLRETQYDDGAAMLNRLGFHTSVHITIDNHTPPTDAQAHLFLQFIQDPHNWPVLVHCAEGEGRTGTLIALTRYAIDGWSMDRALAEANGYASNTALSATQRTWLVAWAQKHAPGDQRVVVADRATK